MNIIEKKLCKITLNTHGGIVLEIDDIIISNCFKGWRYNLKNDNVVREGIFDDIIDAYRKATKEIYENNMYDSGKIGVKENTEKEH